MGERSTVALPIRLALARVRRGRVGLLTDGFALPNFAHRVADALVPGAEFDNSEGSVRFRPTKTGKELLRAGADPNAPGELADHAEQSDDFFDDRRQRDAEVIPPHRGKANTPKLK